MASIHRIPRSKFYRCSFTDSDGERVFRSTKQTGKTEAWRVAIALEDSAKLARDGRITAAQMRKVIAESVSKITGEKCPTPFNITKLRKSVRSSRIDSRFGALIRFRPSTVPPKNMEGWHPGRLGRDDWGNRPIIYILSSSDEQIAGLGGMQKVADWVQHIRTEVQARGGGKPYFVLSEGNPGRAVKLCHSLNLDAVGLYATALGPFGGAPYQTLVKVTEDYWEKLAATGLPLVPNIMTGWDTRPRYRNPPAWTVSAKASRRTPANHYYQEGTPEEIARHIGDAARWLAANPAKAPANTALIYAWDECDEGFGALIPHYEPHDPAGDNARLKAIASVLRRS